MSQQAPARRARTAEIALWCAGWALVVLALVLSLSPRAEDQSGTGLDKLVHAGGYGAMTLCFLLAEARGTGGRAVRLGWIASGVIALGLAIEMAQPLTGRRADPLDLIANVAGVGAGWLVCRRLSRSR